MDEEHVPRPAVNLRAFGVIYLGAILKFVAVCVRTFRLLVGEMQPHDIERRQGAQLAGFTHAVVIRVLPQPQRGKDRISRINQAVAVAAVTCPIIDGEGEEAVLLLAHRRGGLRREVAEQLLPVINCAAAVSIEREPRIIRVCRCSG